MKHAVLAVVTLLGAACSHKVQAPTTAVSSRADALAHELSVQGALPSAPTWLTHQVSREAAIASVDNVLENQSLPSDVTLSDFGDAHLHLGRHALDVFTALAVLTTQRDAGACNADCTLALVRALDFVGGLAVCEQTLVARAVADASELSSERRLELEGWVGGALADWRNELRRVGSQLLGTEPDAVLTSAVLRSVSLAEARDGDAELALRCTRYVADHMPPSPERSMMLAVACYRGLDVACGREASAAVHGETDVSGSGPERLELLRSLERAATDASNLRGAHDLESRLQLAQDLLTLDRRVAAMTIDEALIAEFPDDARAYFALEQIVQETEPMSRAYALLIDAGPANRPAELYPYAAALWLQQTMTAVETQDAAQRERSLTTLGRLRDLMTDFLAFAPDTAVVWAVLVDAVGAIAEGNVEAAQLMIATAQERAAFADEHHRTTSVMGRLRLLLATLDADTARAAATIADVQNRYGSLVDEIRAAMLIRGVAWNEEAMLVLLESTLARVQHPLVSESILLNDVRAVRAAGSPSKTWKRIAAEYRALSAPPSEADDDEARRVHNRGIAEKRAGTPTVVAELPPIPEPVMTPPFGTGALNAVCVRSVRLDAMPLFYASARGRDVLTLEASVWLKDYAP